MRLSIPFRGSNREFAATILKLVLCPPYSVSHGKLPAFLDVDEDRIREKVSRLETDKIIRVLSNGIIS